MTAVRRLGPDKAYRYQGIPGWNPASVPIGGSVRDVRRYGDQAIAVPCPHCHQPAGKMCRGPSGKKQGQPHLARFDAAGVQL